MRTGPAAVLGGLVALVFGVFVVQSLVRLVACDTRAPAAVATPGPAPALPRLPLPDDARAVPVTIVCERVNENAVRAARAWPGAIRIRGTVGAIELGPDGPVLRFDCAGGSVRADLDMAHTDWAAELTKGVEVELDCFTSDYQRRGDAFLWACVNRSVARQHDVVR